ncbi:alpha/beta hydrolase family esterase [Beijerinckia mobilis]|uniref:alpha/beta hydrolase family esterase n=1 Tax=Beijerinckia mobilis TaxID=231434 RepID=UPI001FD979B8|nr:phospholipase [Beijerinckia mobilis]
MVRAWSLIARLGSQQRCGMRRVNRHPWTRALWTRAFCLGLIPSPSLALSLALSFALAGPGHAASGKITLNSGGLSRTAILVQHERLKKSRRPVIIVLHGGSGNGARVRHQLGLEEILNSARPVMVYPDAIGGHWAITSPADAERDEQFILDLIDRLVKDGIADRHRIFLIGVSSGGIVALRLACANHGQWAAVATLLTSLPTDLEQSCTPSAPVPLLMIAGTKDPFVPFQGGMANLPDNKIELLPVATTLALFGKAAGCGDSHTATLLPNRDPNDGTRVTLEKFSGCKVPVELLRVDGGGHTIPGHRGAAIGLGASRGPHNNDIDATKQIWDFFRRFGG